MILLHFVMLLLIYVEDIIFTRSPNVPFILWLIQFVRTLHQGHDITTFLLSIEENNNSEVLLLTQSKYINYNFNCTIMLDCKTSSTPIRFSARLSVQDPSYYHVCGSLQYLMLTRPNITYAIQHAFSHAQTFCRLLNNYEANLAVFEGTITHDLYI